MIDHPCEDAAYRIYESDGSASNGAIIDVHIEPESDLEWTDCGQAFDVFDGHKVESVILIENITAALIGI